MRCLLFVLFVLCLESFVFCMYHYLILLLSLAKFFFLIACDCPPAVNDCYIAGCNSQDECQSVQINYSDGGCCSTDQSCANGFEGNTELENCLDAYCYEDYKTCANIYSCELDLPPQDTECEIDQDCSVISTFCNNVHCVDNICIATPKSPRPIGCCRSATDCTIIEGLSAHCTVESYYYMCIYTESESEPSPTSSPSGSKSNSKSVTSSKSNSHSKTPSVTPSTSELISPSGTPSGSITPSGSASVTSTSTMTPSNTTTPTPTQTPSETTSASVTPSTSESTTFSESGSETIPPPKSESPTSTLSTTKGIDINETLSSHYSDVNITKASSDDNNDSSGFSWAWVFTGGLIIILLVGILIIGIFVFLRQRYLSNQFQPIELLEDEDFPM